MLVNGAWAMPLTTVPVASSEYNEGSLTRWGGCAGNPWQKLRQALSSDYRRRSEDAARGSNGELCGVSLSAAA